MSLIVSTKAVASLTPGEIEDNNLNYQILNKVRILLPEADKAIFNKIMSDCTGKVGDERSAGLITTRTCKNSLTAALNVILKPNYRAQLTAADIKALKGYHGAAEKALVDAAFAAPQQGSQAAPVAVARAPAPTRPTNKFALKKPIPPGASGFAGRNAGTSGAGASGTGQGGH
jgi:hypothetical protein